ncbi:MAG: hypothetical protein QOG31_772 [Thermoplasmata archaeon]|jgi:hypothetical protein|nr:hypothetical protein [Thermoplasmata archaeon]
MAETLAYRRPGVVLLLGLVTFGVYDLVWLRSTLLDTADATGRRPRLGLWWLLLLLYVLLAFAPLVYLDQTVRSRTQDGYLTDLQPLLYIGLAIAALYLVARGLALWSAARRLRELQGLVGAQPSVPPALHLVAIVLPLWAPVGMATLQHDLNGVALGPSLMDEPA